MARIKAPGETEKKAREMSIPIPETVVIGEAPIIRRGTKILSCSCHHMFQDEQYGHMMRLHNLKKEGDFRCTVCGRSRNA